MKFILCLTLASLVSLNVSAKSKGKSYFGKKADFTVTGELHKNALMSSIQPENKKDNVLHFHSESGTAKEIFKTCQTNGDICEVSGSGYITAELKSASINKIKSVKLIKKGEKEKSLVGYNVTGKIVQGTPNSKVETEGGYPASFETKSKVGETIFATCKPDTICKVSGMALKDNDAKVYNIESVESIDLIQKNP